MHWVEVQRWMDAVEGGVEGGSQYFVLAPKVKTLGLHFFGNVVSFVNIVL